MRNSRHNETSVALVEDMAPDEYLIGGGQSSHINQFSTELVDCPPTILIPMAIQSSPQFVGDTAADVVIYAGDSTILFEVKYAGQNVSASSRVEVERQLLSYVASNDEVLDGNAWPSLPPERSERSRKLEKLLSDLSSLLVLDNGWAGPESSSIDACALAEAENFLVSLRSSLKLPEIAPCADGTVNLCWRYPAFYLDAYIDEECRYAFFVIIQEKIRIEADFTNEVILNIGEHTLINSGNRERILELVSQYLA